LTFNHQGVKVTARREDRARKSPRERITVYLEPALRTRLAVYAAERHEQLSTVVALALQRFLDSQKR
jgi:hypothetical protein